MSASAVSMATEGSWGDDALLGGLSTPKVGAAAAAAPLPPPTEEIAIISTTATSETGIKTQITYRYNDKGEVEKVTRKFRVVTMRTRQPEAVRTRREGLLKFGAALNAAENATLTKESPEDIFLELPSAGAEREERATREAFSGGNVSSCRLCGGPHWTMMCPYKEIAKQNGGKMPEGFGGVAGGAGGSGGGGGGALMGMMTGTAAPTGTYKAPGLRPGADGAPRPITEAELTQLKVSNLSPETIEDDLRGLFQPFGNMDPKFRIARDAYGESKCYAYLKYSTHREAEAARANLNGWRLFHMVIKVEFVAPRDPSRMGGGQSAHRHLSGYGKALADTSGAALLSKGGGGH